jgi:hypothetical protein
MHSGKLELCDGVIRYRVDSTTIWELPLSRVRVIGEATNQNGPYLDDYFLCFAPDANSWHEASFYAEGQTEFLKSLESILGCELSLRLCCSTDFDSNVIWPPHLAGKPMFSFTPVQPRTWIGRLIGPLQNTQAFSDEVIAELGGGTRTSRCS